MSKIDPGTGANIFPGQSIWEIPNIWVVPFPVSNKSASCELPRGDDLEIQNEGAVSAFYKLGATAAVDSSTADEELAPGATLRLKVGANTHIACVTRDGATVVTLRGLAPSNEQN
jgi:hypothetical protein